jgi:Flp pilus assembly protein TadD
MNRRKRRAWKLAVKGGRLIGQNQAVKAVEVLKRAVELQPEEPMYWNDYAIALSRAGRANEGIDACRKACEIGRGSESEPQFWYSLGYELFQNGRYREGLEAFERVLSIAKPGTQDYIEAEKGKGYCLTNLRMRS